MKKRSGKGSWIILILAFIIINMALFILITAQPNFEFSIQEQENTNSVQIGITKTSFFPFKSIEVLLDNNPIELTKISKNLYSTVVDKNGTIEIKAVNFNGMVKNMYDHIGSIDDNPPNVYGEVTDKGTVTVTFEDEQSGINYDAIYAVANNDTKHIVPSSVDKEKKTVVFKYNGGTLEVHIFDNIGNEAISTFEDSSEILSNTENNSNNENLNNENSSTKSSNTESSNKNNSSSTKSSKKESESKKNTTSKTSSTKESNTKESSSTKESTSATKKKAESTSAKSSDVAKTTAAKTTSQSNTTKQTSAPVQSSSAKASSSSKTTSATQNSSAAQSTKASSKATENSKETSKSEASTKESSKAESTKAKQSETTATTQAQSSKQTETSVAPKPTTNESPAPANNTPSESVEVIQQGPGA